jgi:hypothetical protein
MNSRIRDLEKLRGDKFRLREVWNESRPSDPEGHVAEIHTLWEKDKNAGEHWIYEVRSRKENIAIGWKEETWKQINEFADSRFGEIARS